MIYDTGKYSPKSFRKIPTPNIDFSNMFDAIGETYKSQIADMEQDYTNISENLQDLDQYKSILGTKFHSKAAQERFEFIRENQIGLSESDLAPPASELTRPDLFRPVQEKIQRLYKHPQVKELFKEDVIADNFVRNIGGLSSKMQRPAREDWERYTVGDIGVESLNLGNYQDMNIDAAASEVLAEVPYVQESRIQPYGVEVVEMPNIERSKDVLSSLGNNEVFMNNLRADEDYGSMQDPLGQFIEDKMEGLIGMEPRVKNIKYYKDPEEEKRQAQEKAKKEEAKRQKANAPKPYKKSDFIRADWSALEEFSGKSNIPIGDLLKQRELIQDFLAAEDKEQFINDYISGGEAAPPPAKSVVIQAKRGGTENIELKHDEENEILTTVKDGYLISNDPKVKLEIDESRYEQMDKEDIWSLWGWHMNKPNSQDAYDINRVFQEELPEYDEGYIVVKLKDNEQIKTSKREFQGMPVTSNHLEIAPSHSKKPAFKFFDEYGKVRNSKPNKRYNIGLDIIPVRAGEDYVAGLSGVVKEVKNSKTGYGNNVTVKSDQTFKYKGKEYPIYVRYSHNKSNLVKQGDKIDPQTKVAKMGNTGGSKGPHVDLSFWIEVPKGSGGTEKIYLPETKVKISNLAPGVSSSNDFGSMTKDSNNPLDSLFPSQK